MSSPLRFRHPSQSSLNCHHKPPRQWPHQLDLMAPTTIQPLTSRFSLLMECWHAATSTEARSASNIAMYNAISIRDPSVVSPLKAPVEKFLEENTHLVHVSQSIKSRLGHNAIFHFTSCIPSLLPGLRIQPHLGPRCPPFGNPRG